MMMTEKASASLPEGERPQTEQSGSPDKNSLRKVLSVDAPLEVAWRVFTEKMGSWWPLETHKIGKAKAVDAIIEPRVGGRWYERGDDGSSCDWGTVLVWEPPSRLVLSWDISADWQPDPALKTEVEVRMIAEGKDRTRLELEHRKLDRFGARQGEMHGIFESPGGWGGLLDAFAREAAKERKS
jgi:uncharacterized protein YndB with AHSA1/START domain